MNVMASLINALIPRETPDPNKEAARHLVEHFVYELTATHLRGHLGNPANLTCFQVGIHLRIPKWERPEQTYISGWGAGRIGKGRRNSVETSFQMLLTETEYRFEYASIIIGSSRIALADHGATVWQPRLLTKPSPTSPEVARPANAAV